MHIWGLPGNMSFTNFTPSAARSTAAIILIYSVYDTETFKNLKNQGVVDVMVTNRTYTNAENLAEKFAGTVIPIVLVAEPSRILMVR